MVFASDDKVQIAGITFLRLKEDGTVMSKSPESTPTPVPTPKPQQPVSSVDSFDDEDDEQDVVPLTELLGDDFNDFRQLYTMYECMKDVHELHTEVINEMNLTDDFLKGKDGDDDAKKKRERDELLSKLEACVDRKLNLASRKNWSIPSSIPKPVIKKAVMNELVGYGPLSVFLQSPAISEIMVNGPERIFIEVKGVLQETGIRFFNERHLIQIIQRIVEPLGRHVDDASPMVDARLPDGSRVNAIIPPLALDGASLTIRKFSEKKLTTDDLIGFGSMTKEMALFLKEAVRSRQNILVSGGTGSGKTTLLNVLSQFIPKRERVVTVEDSAELKLSHRDIVRLEARPANIEGKGRISIRDLVINCLRMRPDRIIVGECRGAEALDMLQAMNTGHDGSLTTAHANNPRDALSRLENMVMMAGFDLPSSAIREQIASAINLIVQQTRLPDGSRKIVTISEVTGRESNVILLQDIFKFEQEGFDEHKKVKGYHTATGNIPYFIDELRKSGDLHIDMSVFVPRN
ncbi:MAG: CpaF family protein [Kiritimatiellae bacterium]|nr:CpaF family protein [Kiritimatiellia bacterium]